MFERIDWKRILVIGAVVLVGGALLWFFFFRKTIPTQSPAVSGIFGTGSSVVLVPNTGVGTEGGEAGPIRPNQKVFKIADGPIVNAVFIQTFNPTTTIARYVMADTGHVLEVAIDTPGAVPRAVSNTTVPGIIQALWKQDGSAVIMQYVEDDIVKTLSLLITPSATSTATTTQGAPLVNFRFLPDNILSIALSPDGKEIAYLLKSTTGATGHTASIQGTGSKRLFSLPLSQVRLSWPSDQTLLAQTKMAAGVPGIAFAVSAKNGSVTPLLYTNGLSAMADSTFSKVVYQTTSNTSRATYAHDVRSGKDVELSFQPIPEKCTWSLSARSFLYCAAPVGYVLPDYLERWYQGVASVADTLFTFNVQNGTAIIITTPGGADGGIASDIDRLSVSPEEKYLLFVTKGGRSLWGVRLAQ